MPEAEEIEEFVSPSTLWPYLTVKGAEAAIAYYESVLGFKCTYKMPAEDGERLMHATLRWNDNVMMLSDEFPEFGGFTGPDKESGSPVAISLRFDDPAEVDRIYTLALKKGGTNSQEPADMFWGDRCCQFYDPFGHRWMLAAPQSKD